MTVIESPEAPTIQAVKRKIAIVGFCCSDAAHRFWAKVDRGSGCWLWQGATSGGYGRFTPHLGRPTLLAHRLAYAALIEPLEAGDARELDHLCRHRSCVNPRHLELVSPRVNVLRSPIAPAAVNAARTRCTNGHLFDERNTYYRIRPGGGRACRTCLREIMRRQRASGVNR